MGFCQAYRHIFTSPFSASKDNLVSEVMSRRRDVASTLHMNYQVTPRSITYTATQVCWHLLIMPSVFADCLPSWFLHLAVHRSGSMNMPAFTTPCSITSLLTISRFPRMRCHRGMLMSFLSGGIGDIHLVFNWSVMSKYLPSFLAKFSPLHLPMPSQLPCMMQHSLYWGCLRRLVRGAPFAMPLVVD